MNDDDRKELEQQEKDMLLSELIPEVIWAFRHPILREWVQEAPSVNSIDNFISSQFRDFEHKMELVKLMRKAVKAWKMIAKENRPDYLKTPKEWRLSDMFIFGLATNLPGRFEKSQLDFATGIMFLPDSSKAVDCSSWPLFLREFCSDKDGDMITSIDDHGTEKDVKFFVIKEFGGEFWKENEAQAYRGNPHDLSERGYKLSFVKQKTGDGRPVVCADISLKHFGICTRIIRIKPERDGQYSRFYKTVCIRDKCYGDVIQVIKIWQPVDCVRSYERGGVIFSKLIKLHDNLNMNLQMEYSFGKEFKLLTFPEDSIYDAQSFIRLDASGCQHSLLFQKNQPIPATEKVTEVMTLLYADFLCVWEYSIKDQKISLESILGQEMIKNPPISLLKFFDGEK